MCAALLLFLSPILSYGGVKNNLNRFATYKIQSLTLNEAVLLAIRNNPSVRNAHLQRVIDKFTVEIAQNEFEPNFTLNARTDYANNALPDYQVKPGASLKTRFGTQLSTDYTQRFTRGGRRAATLSITQPLLRGVRPSVVLAPLHNTMDQEVINRLSLKSQIMRAITQTIRAYYGLVQSCNRLSVRELALKESLNVLEAYKIKFKSGILPRISVVEQSSQVANLRLDVESAKNSVSRARHELLIVLGLDPRSRITVDKVLKVNGIKSFDFKRSVHIALAHNVSYRQAVIGLRSQFRNVLVQKDAQLWDLSVSGSMTVEAGGETGKQTRSSAGVNLTIPIDDVSRQASLVSAKVNLKRAKISLQQSRDQLVADVADLINDLNSQAKQLRLSQRRVTLAEKTYEAALLSHKNGLNSASEVVRQQNILINARLTLINLQINYINTRANFRELLGQTLRDWHVDTF